MRRRRLGLVLLDPGALHLSCVPDPQRGQLLAFLLVAFLFGFFRLRRICHRRDVVPSVDHDRPSVRPKIAFLCPGDDSGRVILARRIKRCQHAAGDHIVKLLLISAEFCRIHPLVRRNNRVMIRYLRRVNRPPADGQLSVAQRAGYIALIGLRQGPHGLHNPGNHIRGQIPAVRPGIGQRLMCFIQTLRDFQRFVRGEAQHSVRVALQTCQVVQLRRHLRLPCRLREDHGSGFPLNPRGDRFGIRLLGNMRVRLPVFAKADSRIIPEVCPQCAVVLRMKAFDFLSALYEDSQRRRLHPAHA